jgi:hypothetical protein
MSENVRVHRPIRNLYAHSNVLLMLLAFAISVVGTRLFLELTGYPQLGNDTFHIAHALWGGVLLVVAALLTLTYVNRWVFQLASVLAGAGVGLFIDEVGKFITQSNDYFFPLAAPLIYVFYLLTVFAYLYVRRSKTEDARAEMYDALVLIQEVLDDNFEESERADLIRKLSIVRQQTDRRDLARLAESLLQFVESDAVTVLPDHSRLPEWLLSRWRRWEDRWLTQVNARRVLLVSLSLLATNAFLQTTLLLALIFNRGAVAGSVLMQLFEENPLVRGVTSLNWFLVSIALEFLMGVLLAMASLLLLRRRDSWAVRVGTIGLLMSLTVTNILKFYFNQFSVVAESLLLFFVLLALFRYQDRFLKGFPPTL